MGFALAGWSAAFVIVGLSEEFAFRGYLQFTLTTGMGFWPSAFAAPAICGGPSASTPGGIGARRFSTASPIAASLHITTCSIPASVGRSGSPAARVGPEASIFTPITLLIVAVAFSFVYREIRYQPLGIPNQ
jgi:hypothetical protein